MSTHMRPNLTGFTMNTFNNGIDMRRVISLFKQQQDNEFSPGLDPVWTERVPIPPDEEPPPDGQPVYFNDLMEYLRQRNASVVGRENNQHRDRVALQPKS